MRHALRCGPRPGNVTAMHDFRFSFNIFDLGRSRDAFAERCCQGERYDYDTIFAADHLGIPAPFPLLVAAAEAAERMRVGTLVLNVPFYNPVLLAREVATTDILTDGRLELGLGAGHMRWEFDEAAIAWEPFVARVERLATMITELERFFTTGLAGRPEGRKAPRPVQHQGFNGSGPPLIVGGTGNRILRIAVEQADIVAIAGVYQVEGQPPGTFRLGTAAEADERVRFARECANGRADELEWHVLIQMVLVSDDRHAAAEKLVAEYAPRYPDYAVDDVLETPFLLIGTIEEMAEQLIDNRARYGFSYITVHEPYMETFAPVIECVRARS
jgi:probable F420-dependent oxidoreductase